MAELIPQQPTTTPKKYAYEGKGWQDPLAQEVAKKYMFSPFMASNYSKSYNDAGNRTFNYLRDSAQMNQKSLDAGNITGYNSPLDPKNWVAGGVWEQRGGKPLNKYQTTPYNFDVDLARKEYLKRGGQGLPEEFYPTDQLTKIKADKAAAATAAEGSKFSLSSDVLNKMWR